MDSEIPEIFIYMLSSMDGIATGEYLDVAESDVALYFEREYSFGSKSILVGRPTMEDGIPKGEIDLSKFKGTKVDRTDYVAPQKNGYYFIAIDSKGKLQWKSSFFLCF